MDESGLRSRLEEIGLEPEQIEDVLPLLISNDRSQTLPQPGAVSETFIDGFRAARDTEEDPVRRVILAARVISAELG